MEADPAGDAGGGGGGGGAAANAVAPQVAAGVAPAGGVAEHEGSGHLNAGKEKEEGGHDDADVEEEEEGEHLNAGKEDEEGGHDDDDVEEEEEGEHLNAGMEEEEGGHDDDDVEEEEEGEHHAAADQKKVAAAVGEETDAAVKHEGQLDDDLLPRQPNPSTDEIMDLLEEEEEEKEVDGDDLVQRQANPRTDEIMDLLEEEEQEKEVDGDDLVPRQANPRTDEIINLLEEEEEEKEIDAPAPAAASTQASVEMGNQNRPLVPPPRAAGHQEADQVQVQELPPAAPAAAAWYSIDYLSVILAGVTILVLGTVLLAELGTDTTTWTSTLKAMTPMRWMLAVFVAIGDTTTLFLTYAPAWKFRGIWRREEGAGVGAGLATMLPLIAALMNAGVWVLYGAVVAGRNWSVIIINGVGIVFQVLYVTAFCGLSETPWRHKLLVLMLGAGADVVIAVVDYFLLHLALGFEMDSAIGWSGAATSITTYAFGCAVNLSAAARNRGARGVPAQAWASLANASIWSVCGAVIEDRRMLTPNLVGVLGFIVQAGQIVYLRCHRPQLEEDEDELQRRLLDTSV